MCGERELTACDAEYPPGSSPRVRGTLRILLAKAGQERFIPACAGNALPFPDEVPGSAVHPRVCGERQNRRDAANQSVGSSPRVRGTLLFPDIDDKAVRFIPACAGNAITDIPRFPKAAVHPRVCGERSRMKLISSCMCGSSPRVRGTQAIYRRAGLLHRFIPACAGNALVKPAGAFQIAVHPRVCGERWSERRRSLRSSGSSPRVRGTLPKPA